MALPEDLDQRKMAEAAIALLSLSMHGEGRVWKGLDWDLMNLLHELDWIHDPKSKARSVLLTRKGEQAAERYLQKHFADKKKASRRLELGNDGKAPHVVRCTANLAKLIPFELQRIDDADVPGIQQWHAKPFKFGRRTGLMFTNSSTLYTVLKLGVGKKSYAEIDGVFLGALQSTLEDAFPDQRPAIEHIVGNQGVVFAKSTSRRVLGSMNDLVRLSLGILSHERWPDQISEEQLANKINQAPMSMLEYASPLSSMKSAM